MAVKWALVGAVLSVFLGCQANLVALEIIVSDPAGKAFGNALTFLQFAGVAILSSLLLFKTTPSGTVEWTPPRRLNARYIAALAVVFYAVSVLNNVVFIFDISIPLHAVFRSASLIFSMAVGFVFRGQRFGLLQMACAVMVSGGVAGLTIATAGEKKTPSASSAVANGFGEMWWWFGTPSHRTPASQRPCSFLQAQTAFSMRGTGFCDRLK